VITKLTTLYKQIRAGICPKVAFKQFYQCLNLNDFGIIVLIICLALIAAILHNADQIDKFQQKQAKAIQYYAQNNAYLRAQAFKSERLVVSLMNGSLRVNGALKTYCELSANGDCK
jgi:hypothetical protein